MEKVIERTQQQLASAQLYEAHQGTRTIVARYIRQKKYNEAIELLYKSCLLMLKADQQGSASDLLLYLISTYKTAGVTIASDRSSRSHVAEILKAFDPQEPSLKSKIAPAVVAWSENDRELHHVLGTIFAKADLAYEAENHLLQGTRDSAKVLANLLFEWYSESDDIADAPLFLARGVLGYLAVQNIRETYTLQEEFISLLLTSKYPQPVEQTKEKIYIFDDESSSDSRCQLINFLQLLVPTCQTKSVDLFNRLRARYDTPSLLQSVPALRPSLTKIGTIYFGIMPPRNNNMLDMLSGMFQ